MLCRTDLRTISNELSINYRGNMIRKEKGFLGLLWSWHSVERDEIKLLEAAASIDMRDWSEENCIRPLI
jgi:hypothetical protein